MRRLATAVGIAAILCGPVVVQAQEGVSQTIGHGKIDWSKKTITATGSAAPSLKAKNVAAARLGAERAAKLDAFRNILEAVKGVRVSGNHSAGTLMKAKPDIQAKIEGIINKFKILDTKYYSDGGVDVVVEVPLSGVLMELLVPQAGTKTEPGTPNGQTATGVVVNAKGLGATPALAPRILDESGNEVYSAAMVSREAAAKEGVVGYATSVEMAAKDPRVGDKPLVVRATKTSAPGGSDVIVPVEEAAKIAKLTAAISGAKVIIVTD